MIKAILFAAVFIYILYKTPRPQGEEAEKIKQQLEGVRRVAIVFNILVGLMLVKLFSPLFK